MSKLTEATLASPSRINDGRVDELLRRRKLLVCVGPGGVGKTTIAATLALRAACLGLRTLVLTIDPARRLADALGLDMADDTIHTVDTSSLVAGGVDVPGRLDAIMFDNAKSMDSLMGRLAPSERAREQILGNRVYRAMAGSLARSHAYLAMERLHEVMSSGDYDIVVLDTPPARNALDILDAPGRLSSFLDEGVMKWFTREPSSGGLRAKIRAAGGATAKKLFGIVAGERFLHEVIGFFDAFKDLREGFHRRSMETQSVLESDQAGFILVSSAEASHLEDARSLGRSVIERGLSVHGLVFNRSYDPLAPDPMEIVTDPAAENDVAEVLAPVVAQAQANDAGTATRLMQGLAELRVEAAAANARALVALRSLADDFSSECFRVIVAKLDDDICDLRGLHGLASYLGRSSALLEQPSN